MPATNNMRGAGEIVKTIRRTVMALQFSPGQYGSPPDTGLPMFDRVELFDSEQLTEAFRYVLITEQRVCVVVPLDEHYESVITKQKLMVKRMLPVALLISDRVLGSRQEALYGNEDTPGAIRLADLTRPAVTGLVFAPGSDGLPGVLAEPIRCGVMAVRDTEGDLPSRVGMALELECKGGYLETPLPVAPIF